MANVGADYRLVDGSVDIEQGPRDRRRTAR